MIHKCDNCGTHFNGNDGYYMLTDGGWVGCSEACVTADGQTMEEFFDEETTGGFWTEDEDEDDIETVAHEMRDLLWNLQDLVDMATEDIEGDTRYAQLMELLDRYARVV